MSFVLAMPGTTAAFERTSSIENSPGTDQRNCFVVEMKQETIVVRSHFQGLSCKCHSLLLNNPKLLQNHKKKYVLKRNVSRSELNS